MVKSKNPGKQRKALYNAPLHKRQKLVAVHLSKDAKVIGKKRSVTVRKGDSVSIMRGGFKGKSGKVSRVDLKMLKVYVEGVKRKRVSGEEVVVGFDPSNLIITSLFTEDKKRQESFLRGSNKVTKLVDKVVAVPSSEAKGELISKSETATPSSKVKGDK